MPDASSPPAAHHVYTVDDTPVAVTLHEPRPAADVPEALVQALWRDQRFDREALQTTDGTPVTIHDPGRINADSGPDFLDAHLQIGAMTWRGAVEIHTTSGDWFAHGHHEDARYNSVVLHVTLHADTWTGGLLREDQTVLPEFVLAPRLDRPLRRLLHQFLAEDDRELVCAPQWTRVPAVVRTAWIEQLANDRMAAKQRRLEARYQARPDLEQLLYERLFAGLGYAKNDDPMETLARRVPLATARAVEDPIDREALFFGVADLLPRPADLLESDRATADYAMDLRDRFRRLQASRAIGPMKRTQWTFFRLRPANFPPLRIAQGLAWLHRGALLHRDPVGTLMHAVQANDPVAALRKALHARPHAFWNTHLRLVKSTKEREPSLGRGRIDTLIVNAILPWLLVVADQRSQPELRAQAFDVLRALPAKTDRVVRVFKQLGTPPDAAYHAQGMHHLYRTYCRPGRCLSCTIGRHLLGE
jgi:hypothetical protein